MTKSKVKKANEPTTVVANDPEDRKGALNTNGGSQSDHWNNTLANQAVQALWVKNSDAQAVVGTVERPAGGDQTKMEEQPHAKQIAHAPEPALWRADAEGHAVPVPRDGERSLPDARGKVSGRTDR